MKKIADFIVNKRFLVLGVMVALCLVCCMMIPKVVINTDMTKYLPEDSSMGQGMALMEKEFPDTKMPSTIRVMFKNLSEVDKSNVKNKLENIEYVDSVTYNPDINDKDGYSLFTVSTSYAYSTPEEMAIESDITSGFNGYEMVMKNDNATGANLPMWVIGLAFGLLMLVLIVMTSSWFEPVLFLATIGVAVGLNMGSNIMFPTVSQMTFSISAILQVVLSMDYSIILMNRYRQEKATAPDKYTAMKEALRNSFSSVASSGMTTVIGLLMLVFMSFTIGLDLGLVLAKGVLLSMLCVFTVLPVLILIFDKVIEKSSKKELHIPFGKVATFGYKARKIIAIVFVIVFVGTYFLQNITQITYTISTEDEIAEIFPTSNPVVLIYNNEDEEKIAPIGDKISGHKNVNSVLGYTTTLGKSFTANEMVAMIDTMGADMGIDASLLSVLYYDKLGDKSQTLTVNEVLTFVKESVLPNEMFSSFIDEGMKDNMGLMDKFIKKENLTSPMNAKELADFLSMNEDDIKKIFMLYFAEKGGVDTGRMTLPVFADFIINEVATNEMYASFFDENTKSQLGTLEDFCDVKAITKPLTSDELATKLGVDKDKMQLLFAYYYSSVDSYTPAKMTVTTFVDFIKNDILSNDMFKSYFDEETASQITMLSQFANKEAVQKQMTAKELSSVLGIEESLVESLFTLKFVFAKDKTMSIEEMVDFVLEDVAANPLFASQIDEEMIPMLQLMQKIIDNVVSGEKLSCKEMANMLSMKESDLKIIYSVYDFTKNSPDKKLSLETVVNFLAENKDMFAGMMEKEQLSLIETGKAFINGAVSGKAYSYQGIADLVGMDSAQLRQLFLLYKTEHGDTSSWKISVQNFIDFILSDVVTNKDFAGYFDKETESMLGTADVIIDSVISDKKYSSAELAGLLEGFSDQLNENTVSLLYLYYSALNSSNKEWSLTIEELFDHLYNNMLDDPRFTGMIDEGMKEQILGAKTQLDDGLKQMKGKNYSLMMIDTSLPLEDEVTTEFIENLIKDCDESLEKDYYLIGNSPMSYEMQQSFDKELLFITLLTAIAIFLVVAITFRSISIPLILVLLVQSGVYITVAVSGFLGYSVYYLALLVVQCILMGATIDYGILFTNYYRENRRTMSIRDAINAAYDGSTHTIFTSGLIMVFVTGVIGFAPVDPTIAQICQTIAIGAAAAILLILFMLPGLLAAFDKLTSKDKSKKKQNNKEGAMK
ncbi:MAG: MMPL family transporter [Clostridia bacterium]|nr:MMPL family transporter [Clostridia bacterium]